MRLLVVTQRCMTPARSRAPGWSFGGDDVQPVTLMLLAACLKFWGRNGSLKRWCLQGLGQDLTILYSAFLLTLQSCPARARYTLTLLSPVWHNTRTRMCRTPRSSQKRHEKGLETAAANAARTVSKAVRFTAHTHAHRHALAHSQVAHWAARS